MAKKESWEVTLTRSAEKVYDRAGKSMQSRLDDCFEALERAPLAGSNIKQLTGQLKGLARYRVGEWRVIYNVDRERGIVEVIAILPRGDAYR